MVIVKPLVLGHYMDGDAPKGAEHTIVPGVVRGRSEFRMGNMSWECDN